MQYARSRERGFTLIELLAVIALVIACTGASALFLKPKDYSSEANNAKRWTDVSQIAQALKAYGRDNGKMPDGITLKSQVIGSDEANGAVNLCSALVPKYLKQIPLDPGGIRINEKSCTGKDADYVAGYAVARYVDGSVVVSAPIAEHQEQISIRVPAPMPKPTQ
ncbi:MAG TPA: type II secretion system protein [Candidatus Saccharimonadales bacterium]|nr:type II secretion system protein [Candidatus Saccharimonadales bacterium]